MKKFFKNGALIVGSLLPIMVLAQGGITGVNPLTPENVNIQNIINNIANWVLGILVALATLFVLYAAYIYLTAGGDEAKLETAKNTLIYAAVAIAVGLLSRVVAYIVRQLIA